ncbi:UPF0280 family protein [Mangrovibacterium lignilyticum]|uniref:UPF0280 family protein n=1 Tax=Mangrovibacterium lignilyticum TaxID=2668052 RepID=UPI0013D855BA|nr:UPF0280 family protein [Mangrovibacterium lignilyticum]
MLFEARTFRNSFPKDRFQSFVVEYLESDVWVGVDPESYRADMEVEVLQVLTKAVDELKAYVEENPLFRKSLKACAVAETAPEAIRKLAHSAELGAVGPLAARSGLLNELIGQALLEKFEIGELIVENGGDLYLKLRDSLIVSIFADDLEDSGLMGLEVMPEQTPLGIGTGLGTKGHPINHGKADAVMIMAKNGADAGALAVGVGNRVKKLSDLEKVLKHLKLMPEVTAAVLIVEDQIAVHGDNELKLIS